MDAGPAADLIAVARGAGAGLVVCGGLLALARVPPVAAHGLATMRLEVRPAGHQVGLTVRMGAASVIEELTGSHPEPSDLEPADASALFPRLEALVGQHVAFRVRQAPCEPPKRWTTRYLAETQTVEVQGTYQCAGRTDRATSDLAVRSSLFASSPLPQRVVLDAVVNAVGGECTFGASLTRVATWTALEPRKFFCGAGRFPGQQVGPPAPSVDPPGGRDGVPARHRPGSPPSGPWVGVVALLSVLAGIVAWKVLGRAG